MKAEVVGVHFEGHKPVSITVRVGSVEGSLPLEALWEGLLKSSFSFIDPFSVKAPLRAAVIGRDGRPDFAVVKLQDSGHLFLRSDGLAGERYSPEQLRGKVVHAEQMPILMAWWLRSVRDKMNHVLPKIPRMS